MKFVLDVTLKTGSDPIGGFAPERPHEHVYRCRDCGTIGMDGKAVEVLHDGMQTIGKLLQGSFKNQDAMAEAISSVVRGVYARLEG